MVIFTVCIYRKVVLDREWRLSDGKYVAYDITWLLIKRAYLQTITLTTTFTEKLSTSVFSLGYHRVNKAPGRVALLIFGSWPAGSWDQQECHLIRTMIRTNLSSIQLLNFPNGTQNTVNLVLESAVSFYLLKSAVFICHIFAFLESAATMNLTARGILLLHNLCESTDWVFILGEFFLTRWVSTVTNVV